MAAQPNYDYLFKYVVIGDSWVGKSSIILQYAEKIFYDPYIWTIGVDFKIRTIEVDSKIVKLQVWDACVGAERFRPIMMSYFRRANAAIVVYDITRKESFDNLDRWVNSLEMSGWAQILYVLVGNKCDLEEKREVTYDEGLQYAQEHNMLFAETSAKDDINIDEVFNNITGEVKSNYDYALENGLIPENNLPLSVYTSQANKKGIWW